MTYHGNEKMYLSMGQCRDLLVCTIMNYFDKVLAPTQIHRAKTTHPLICYQTAFKCLLESDFVIKVLLIIKVRVINKTTPYKYSCYGNSVNQCRVSIYTYLLQATN